MDESKLGFLYKAASILTRPENKTYDILRSHYLMRCPEIASLGDTPSSTLSKVRCSHCCLEWKSDTKIRIIPSKMSKRQKRRINSNSNTKNSLILHCKQLERICSLCGYTSAIHVPKFNKKENNTNNENKVVKVKPNKKKETPIEKKQESKNQKSLNVYSNISEIYSMKNDSNKLQSPRVPVKINNNKKKKDKFAGLCQKAVLDAVKRKTQIEKKNKLNIFLKPSA